MCELFAMSALHPSLVRYELDLFASEGGERHVNRDGWGLMLAEERDAHLYREASPAADSDLARFALNHRIHCHHLISHVRRASRGRPLLANTHPFTRALRGRVAHFAHNGTLHGLENLPEAERLLPERVGDTDSELAFLLLLARIARAPDADRIEGRFKVFTQFCAEMRHLGSANFLFHDGEAIHIHADQRMFETDTGLSAPREPGLVMRHFGGRSAPSSWRGRSLGSPEVHPQTLLFASVPLDCDGWEPLRRGTALVTRHGKVLAQEIG